MKVQLSVEARDARLEALHALIGVSPILELRSGPPAKSTAEAAGELLADGALPARWMAVASSGSKPKLGTWQIVGGAKGQIAHFRLLRAATKVCHMQGDVTVSGRGGAMEIDRTLDIEPGQVVYVTKFTLVDANE